MQACTSYMRGCTKTIYPRNRPTITLPAQINCSNLANIRVSISSQADAEADAKAMEQAMSIWNLEFHDPILETVSSRIRKNS